MLSDRSLAPLLALVLAACGSSSKLSPTEPSPAGRSPTGRFHYDATTGKCTDGAAAAGLNPVDAATLFPDAGRGRNTFANGNAECVDFTDFDFNKYMNLSYSVLSRWNLRGAKLTRAKFLFAKMEGVDLAGTDLSELDWGYTTIEGAGDKFTRLPEGCPAKARPEEIFCMR